MLNVYAANLQFGTSSDAEVCRECVVGTIDIIDVSFQTPTGKDFILHRTVSKFI